MADLARSVRGRSLVQWRVEGDGEPGRLLLLGNHVRRRFDHPREGPLVVLALFLADSKTGRRLGGLRGGCGSEIPGGEGAFLLFESHPGLLRDVVQNLLAAGFGVAAQD